MSTITRQLHALASLPSVAADRVHGRLVELPAARHLGVGVVAIATLAGVNAVLNWMYVASNHPVSYAEGQTSFDAAAVKGWYATMLEAGTLDVYVATQMFDFVFMVALASFGLAASSLLRRWTAPHRWMQAVARVGGVAVVAGTVFDAIENLVSFIMLAAPARFPDFLVVVYSGAAVVKFVLIGVGLAGLTVALVAGLVALVGRVVGGLSSAAFAA